MSRVIHSFAHQNNLLSAYCVKGDSEVSGAMNQGLEEKVTCKALS